jgi:mono/diheme cytochrome c family protein
VTGDGAGPDARQLEPYPRDYRRGIFKFKRTPSTIPPTDADLHNILVRGVPGTAMPSFRLLNQVEREALVQYVRYLSIRGEYERAIIEEAAFELDEDELLLDPELRETSGEYQLQLSILQDIAADVVEPWLEASDQVVTVPPRPDDYDSPEAIARGRELFFTTLTNCATCHGPTALGDGQMEDYDEWAKELDPTRPEVLKDYLALGALPPRHVDPRDLHEGIFRGGHQPEDLFVKVKYGIAGTTMPTVAAQLSDEDVWYLVAYARYLPFDPILRPARRVFAQRDAPRKEASAK